MATAQGLDIAGRIAVLADGVASTSHHDDEDADADADGPPSHDFDWLLSPGDQGFTHEVTQSIVHLLRRMASSAAGCNQPETCWSTLQRTISLQFTFRRGMT